MNQQNNSRVIKMEKQCAILAEIVISIRSAYANADPEQKVLIETMIGAAIWYIPKSPDAWTGSISLGALKAFHPDSKVEKPKISEEHVYPRKVAARRLLEDGALDASTMAKVFREKYGQLHYITSNENKVVQPYQRVDVFTTPADAYAKAGITLIPVEKQHLRQIKKRNRDIIDSYLKNYKDNMDA
jgi:hypothetical protein